MRYLLFRLKRFCGFVIGFVFFISGILKLMDPVGSGLVMKEYMEFLHIGFLESAAKTFGTSFALLESLIGAALITGVWRKITASIAVGMQTFFTLLTLFLVILKPEMDCGCFGEAIHLTHGETFIKNLFILASLLIYYIPIKYLGETKKKKYISFTLVSFSTCAFALYSLLYIPMVDFTDFKPGTKINSNTETADTYEATFVYSKDGKEGRFFLENLPDTTWTFVRTEMSETKDKKNSIAVISIQNKNGEYADSLLKSGRIMAITVYKETLSLKDTKELNTFIADAKKKGFSPIVLTSTHLEGIHAQTYSCDYKTLITLNRSNGGVTYINDGIIIRKWAKRALPDLEDLAMLSEENPTDSFIGRDTGTNLAFQGFMLYVFAVMLLL